MKMAPDTSNPQRDRSTFVAAVRLVAISVVIALAVFFGAMLWLNGCKTDSPSGALDNCSALQRNVFAIGPAAVLFIGGVSAFVRTIQVWRARGGWWIWQGGGWFLMVLMLVVLAMTVPSALLS